MSTPYRYDAFISYRHGGDDEKFALDLVRKLEADGYKVAIDHNDFVGGASLLYEMERCVKESRFTLAFVSSRYLTSGFCDEEAVICKVLSMVERQRRLIPLRIEDVHMPTWMFSLVPIDFFRAPSSTDPYEKLKRDLGHPI